MATPDVENRTYANVEKIEKYIWLQFFLIIFRELCVVLFYIESGNKSMKCNENYLFCCE